MVSSCGSVTLLGSGETSLAGGRIFESVSRQLSPPVCISILETPAGFELNSMQVAGRVGEFLKSRLKNYDPQVSTIPARKRGTAFSPDDEKILSPLYSANLIFMGPGSPTYAIRQLKKSLAWKLVRARQRKGAALVFASAATIAVGRWGLPVYEIYKVGDEPRRIPGLDLFADFGLRLSFIPHWNNSDGGKDVDTSRCFVGKERFEKWVDRLPAGEIVIGLDEHTGLTFDLAQEKCIVQGAGAVTVLIDHFANTFTAGTEFPLSHLGKNNFSRGISLSGSRLHSLPDHDEIADPTEEVLGLLEARNVARGRKNWTASDAIRKRIAELGWQVRDTPLGQTLVKKR
jgi:hypothetical protein